MQRLVILGCTGSGKTTLGKKAAARLGCPALDLDEFYWLPNWVARETDDFYRRVDAAASEGNWVIMGNYSKVRNAVWPRATAFVWLDYSFPRVFWQLLRRSLSRVIDQNRICNGNTESWRKFFSRDSIMVWFFKTFHKRRREYGEIFAAAGHLPSVTYIRLKSPKQADEWLSTLKE